MPKHSEKKFKVDSFVSIQKKLSELDAKLVSESESHHYYGVQASKDVAKLVVSDSKCEIHILKEKEGTFNLTEKFKVKNKDEGIKWLQKNGFKEIVYIKMAHRDYAYGNGIVGLYVINDSLLSVILDYPTDSHAKLTEILDLDTAEVIVQPYNQYLQK